MPSLCLRIADTVVVAVAFVITDVLAVPGPKEPALLPTWRG